MWRRAKPRKAVGNLRLREHSAEIERLKAIPGLGQGRIL